MSKKGYARAQRGMVFWFSGDETYKESLEYEAYNGKIYKSNVQRGYRPYMVVSNNDGNYSAPTCNIVPITLEEKANIPVHVNFMWEGKKQTILCEQVRTVDVMALKDYIYTVSDEILEKVERALATQYAIRPVITYADFKLDRTIRNLESVISAIIQNKVENIQQQESRPIPVKDIEDTALKLGQMIEELVGVPASTENNTEKVESITIKNPVQQPKSSKSMSQVDKFNSRLQKSKAMNHDSIPTQPTSTPKDKDIVSKPKRNVWTTESRKAYLEDFDNLSPSEMMKKYNLSSVQSVIQTKYACRNALMKRK